MFPQHCRHFHRARAKVAAGEQRAQRPQELPKFEERFRDAEIAREVVFPAITVLSVSDFQFVLMVGHAGGAVRD